jgi:hypothetical protein
VIYSSRTQYWRASPSLVAISEKDTNLGFCPKIDANYCDVCCRFIHKIPVRIDSESYDVDPLKLRFFSLPLFRLCIIMFLVSLGKLLSPFCKVLRQWIWSFRESYTFLYFNNYTIDNVALWYSHKYRTFRPLKVIKILQIQFCSLLKAAVLKCQLLILFMTSKIVLSATKNFCLCQEFYRRVFHFFPRKLNEDLSYLKSTSLGKHSMSLEFVCYLMLLCQLFPKRKHVLIIRT